MKKFLDCISVVGSTPSRFQGKKKYVSTGAVATTEIDESEVVEVSYEDRPSRANLTAEAGDILFAKMQGTRKTLLLDSETEDNIYSTGFFAVRANPEIITTECLYYLIDSELFLSQKDKNCSGATQKAITNGGLAKIEISVPPLSEQGILTEKLKRLTQLIADKRKQLELLDEVIKSRFIEMFGDLKTNPYHWKCKNLLDIATIDTVMVTDYEKYANYPHVGIDSIEKNTGRLFGYRTIAEDKVISGKYLFTPKHIIYSKIRPNLNKVAMPDFEGLCSADAYPILPNENICLRIYLGCVMRSEFFLEYILPFSRRANMPKVNKEQLSGFVLPIPNIDLQQQFAAFVEQVDKSKYHGESTYKMEVAA